MAKKRIYKKGVPGSEYDRDHASPEAKKNRAARNSARAEAMKEGKVKKGDGKEVAHLKPLSKGGSNSKNNTRVMSREANRKMADKTPAQMKKATPKKKGGKN